MALEEQSVDLGQEAQASLEQERQRIELGLVAIANLTELFDKHNLPFMVIKTGDHYPDLGHDIDIFVAEGGDQVEELLGHELGAKQQKRSVSELLSAKTNWRRDSVTIEVHAGRLGQVGEHRQLADELFKLRRPGRVGRVDTFVPSPEGRVVLALLQRVYRHFNFRLCDVINLAGLIEDRSLNRDLLWRLCKDGGIHHGVALGIGMVADLFDRLGEPLLLSEGDRVPHPVPFPLLFQRGHYRFALGRVVPSVFARQLGSCLGRGALSETGRLTVLAFLMGFVGLNIRVFPGIPIWRKLW